MTDTNIQKRTRQLSARSDLPPNTAQNALSEQVDTAIFAVQELTLCTFVDSLAASLTSKKPLPEVPEVGEEWQRLAQELHTKTARCKGSIKTFRSLLGTLRSSDPAFDQLYERWLSNRNNKASPSAKVSPPAPAPVVSSSLMPALNPAYLPAPGLSAGVGRWVNGFTEFCKKWAGRSYEGHYEVAAMWLLATVAASRVGIVDGELTWTPVFAVIVADSSVWGKTTLVKIPSRILKQAGLSWLFGSNLTSPEKLLSNMAGHVPANYAEMTLEQQATERLRRAHCGQVGWNYPEFGQLLTEMSNDRGRNAAFKHILRVMDDCEEEFSIDTHLRQREPIERPCIALVGTMTPTCMQPYAGTGSDSWTNGLYGRLWFACPPAGVRKTREQLEAETRPAGEMVVPDSLVRPLVEWNKRLGVRDCAIEILTNKNGDTTGYDVTLGEFPVTKYTFAPGVKKMLEDYGIELMLISQEPALKQLESCYARLRDKAMRVAALIASIEDKGTHVIEAAHMAYGIEYAERRRQDLHNLVANLQVNGAELADKALDTAIFGELKRRQKAATVREMSQANRDIQRAHREGRLDSKLKELVEAGELIRGGTGRKVEYGLPGVQ